VEVDSQCRYAAGEISSDFYLTVRLGLQKGSSLVLDIILDLRDR
jgi:hypothetical protein